MYLNVADDFSVNNALFEINDGQMHSRHDVLAEFSGLYGENACTTLPILPAVSACLHSSATLSK